MDRSAPPFDRSTAGADPPAGGRRRPQFSRPVRQIVQMLVVLGLVGAGAWVVYPSVAPVFLANPYLNGGIVAVFFIGVIACFWQVLQLMTSVRWIEGFAQTGASTGTAPRLLAPLAALLRARGLTRKITATAAASILDSVGTRIEEGREVTRYLVSLLIFLGLLGTFYGLATVVPAVVETIRSLAPQEGEGGVDVFNRLMTGLEAQLGGMGTAFGSSLLGLAGSLVVGLLELFSARGQNRFYRELEEWLTSFTRLGFAGAESDGPGDGTGEGAGEVGAVVALLDQMAEQMDAMRLLHVQAEAARAATDDKLSEVARAVTALTRQLERGEDAAGALARVAETQEALLGRLGEGGGAGAGEGAIDAESRMRLRSIDVQLLRILEELAAGRQETVADLRADLAQIAREMRRGRTAGPMATGLRRPEPGGPAGDG